MIFSKNTSNISLIEAELQRLKNIYSKALEAENIPTLTELRKKIKVLRARWNIMRDCTINVNPDPQKTNIGNPIYFPILSPSQKLDA